MAAFRLLLILTLVASLAVVCPACCYADAARTTAGAAEVEAGGCPCCRHEAPETPAPPAPDDCCDGNCICDGAVDGPRVAAIDFQAPDPAGLPAEVSLSVCACDCPPESHVGRPAAPDGATLRLLMASLVI